MSPTAFDGQRGEALAQRALADVAAGAGGGDRLERAILNSLAIDGWCIPPGSAFRAACREIQARLAVLQREHPPPAA